MALPDLIEIVPLAKPVRAEITVPGSKSITNRALVLAALAEGETTLQGALWSEDTQVMVECLQELGFMVNVAPDPNEGCNRTITVYGLGGKIPAGGTKDNPLELFVGNAGTTARFLAALVCLGSGVYRLHGVARMHERPQAALFQALRELGYHVDSANNRLPALIYGSGPKPRSKCTVSIEESSQFASALLLSANVGGWNVQITGENAEESPYVIMTSELIATFPKKGGRFLIEPDASSASYFWGAAQIDFAGADRLDNTIHWLGAEENFSIQIARWPRVGWQIDSAFFWIFIRLMRGSPFVERASSEEEFRNLCANWQNAVACNQSGIKPPSVSRRNELGDSIMTAVVLAPLAVQPVRFTDLARLRLQECERVTAMRTELTKCGAKVIEEGDTLTVFPSQLHGAEIETYNDHRMAMSFAILGLKVPGIKIKNPGCVKKTFPNFFQKLATAPPHGLGATILETRTDRRLAVEDLFAE